LQNQFSPHAFRKFARSKAALTFGVQNKGTLGFLARILIKLGASLKYYIPAASVDIFTTCCSAAESEDLQRECVCQSIS